nr:MAG TPA: hypothetical protein [Caudoviricetes sp.]
MKIEKTVLNALKKSEIITLEMIHDMLEVKQHINNYQRNTNKKYGLNLEKDELINREIADIIIINTLGKLNMLPEQAYFMRLVRNEDKDTLKARKAELFAEKANLADKMAEMLEFVVNNSYLDMSESTLDNFLEKEKVQNSQYFGFVGKSEWLRERAKWLINTYRG